MHYSEFPNYKEIVEIFQPDTIYKVIERAAASDSAFAKNLVETLGSMSPLALAVNFEIIKRSQGLEYREVLQFEWQVAALVADSCEFFEGVRALLIDKDNKPQWKFKSLTDITPDLIETFFKPSVEPIQLE